MSSTEVPTWTTITRASSTASGDESTRGASSEAVDELGDADANMLVTPTLKRPIVSLSGSSSARPAKRPRQDSPDTRAPPASQPPPQRTSMFPSAPSLTTASYVPPSSQPAVSSSAAFSIPRPRNRALARHDSDLAHTQRRASQPDRPHVRDSDIPNFPRPHTRPHRPRPSKSAASADPSLTEPPHSQLGVSLSPFKLSSQPRPNLYTTESSGSLNLSLSDIMLSGPENQKRTSPALEDDNAGFFGSGSLFNPELFPSLAPPPPARSTREDGSGKQLLLSSTKPNVALGLAEAMNTVFKQNASNSKVNEGKKALGEVARSKAHDDSREPHDSAYKKVGDMLPPPVPVRHLPSTSSGVSSAARTNSTTTTETSSLPGQTFRPPSSSQSSRPLPRPSASRRPSSSQRPSSSLRSASASQQPSSRFGARLSSSSQPPRPSSSANASPSTKRKNAMASVGKTALSGAMESISAGPRFAKPSSDRSGQSAGPRLTRSTRGTARKSAAFMPVRLFQDPRQQRHPISDAPIDLTLSSDSDSDKGDKDNEGSGDPDNTRAERSSRKAEKKVEVIDISSDSPPRRLRRKTDSALPSNVSTRPPPPSDRAHTQRQSVVERAASATQRREFDIIELTDSDDDKGMAPPGTPVAVSKVLIVNDDVISIDGSDGSDAGGAKDLALASPMTTPRSPKSMSKPSSQACLPSTASRKSPASSSATGKISGRPSHPISASSAQPSSQRSDEIHYAGSESFEHQDDAPLPDSLRRVGLSSSEPRSTRSHQLPLPPQPTQHITPTSSTGPADVAATVKVSSATGAAISASTPIAESVGSFGRQSDARYEDSLIAGDDVLSDHEDASLDMNMAVDTGDTGEPVELDVSLATLGHHAPSETAVSEVFRMTERNMFAPTIQLESELKLDDAIMTEKVADASDIQEHRQNTVTIAQQLPEAGSDSDGDLYANSSEDERSAQQTALEHCRLIEKVRHEASPARSNSNTAHEEGETVESFADRVMQTFGFHGGARRVASVSSVGRREAPKTSLPSDATVDPPIVPSAKRSPGLCKNPEISSPSTRSIMPSQSSPTSIARPLPRRRAGPSSAYAAATQASVSTSQPAVAGSSSTSPTFESGGTTRQEVRVAPKSAFLKLRPAISVSSSTEPGSSPPMESPLPSPQIIAPASPVVPAPTAALTSPRVTSSTSTMTPMTPKPSPHLRRTARKSGYHPPSAIPRNPSTQLSASMPIMTPGQTLTSADSSVNARSFIANATAFSTPSIANTSRAPPLPRRPRAKQPSADSPAVSSVIDDHLQGQTSLSNKPEHSPVHQASTNSAEPSELRAVHSSSRTVPELLVYPSDDDHAGLSSASDDVASSLIVDLKLTDDVSGSSRGPSTGSGSSPQLGSVDHASDGDVEDEMDEPPRVTRRKRYVPSEAASTSSAPSSPPPNRTTRSMVATRRSTRTKSQPSNSSSSGHLSVDSLRDGSESEPPSSVCTSPEVEPKTYAGIPVFDFSVMRRQLLKMSLPYRLSTEIPTSTQDYINARFDRYGVNLPQMRENFQSYIIASTVNEEPNAPPIRIFNDVDAEATPPWEFHYTNEMFHSPDVPPPVRSKVYCDCEGKCGSNAKSKCACLKRQEEWTKASGGDFKREKGFVYDAFGRVRFAYVPIFECNDLCGCDEECRNRVVQHGRKVQVNIRKTLKKGWGVFNGDNTIHSGTFIGIYSGELITDAEGERRGQKYYKRTYLFDLDCYHLRPLVNRPGEPPKRLSREELQRLDDEWTPKYTVDAFHAGNFTRFLNHSCDPNCNMTAVYINEGNVDKPLLVVFSSRDIYPGEELCFSYSGPVDESPQVKDGKETRLSDEIYMVCECGAFNCKGRMFK